MTFTEAAVEVLRLVGKPLHYKKITEVAIERSLLSHVGKTPEVTMSSRLATMVKRDRGDAPIIKVKPGVFGLREFNEQQLSDLSGDVDELPEVDVESEQSKADDAETAEAEALKRAEPKRPLPGADVFPEEADDDEPILGGSDDDDEDDDDEEAPAEAGAEGAAGESRSARRRRKRRRRGGEDAAAEEPRAARERPEAAPAVEARERSDRERPAPRERNDRERQGRDRSERERERSERDRERNERSERDRSDRERDRSERERDRSERERDRGERDRDRGERVARDGQGDFQRDAADGDLLGKDLADAVASVLAQSTPRGLPALRVADMLVRRGRLSGDAQQLVPTVMAAVRADISRRSVDQTRPRFRVDAGNVVLTDMLLPQDVVRAEQDVLRAAERQRERARRAFMRRVSELPATGLAELVATWLNAEGVIGLRAVRRPMSGAGELHLAGTLRRGVEEVRLAVVVYRDTRDLGRERVVEARGALHYYGGATSAWIVSLGNVLSGAREEALAPATAPVSLFDGMALAAAMERVGVGLAVQHVAVSSIDFEFLDALRGPQPREREERGRDERPREREERGREREERGRNRDDARRDERNRDEPRRDERNREDARREDRTRDERSRDESRREEPRARDGRDEPRRDPRRSQDDEFAVREEDGEHDLRDELGEEAAEGAEPQNGDANADGEAARNGQPGQPAEGRRRKRRRRRKGRGDQRDVDPAAGPGAEAGAAGDAGDDDDADGFVDDDSDGPRQAVRADGELSPPGYAARDDFADDESADERLDIERDSRDHDDHDHERNAHEHDERDGDGHDERHDDERHDDERHDDERNDDERNDDGRRHDARNDDERSDDEREPHPGDGRDRDRDDEER